MSFRLVHELAAGGVLVAVACRVLRVSTSGYYEWRGRAPSLRAAVDAALTIQIREVHASSRGTYGVPRVNAELRLGRGIRCGRKRIARLMRAARLHGVTGVGESEPAPYRLSMMIWCDGVLSLMPRIGSGSPTSPSTRPAKARSSALRYSTCTPGGSSAGRSPTTCVGNSSWTRWRWPAGAVDRPSARPSSTPIAAPSTLRGRSVTGSARQVCSARWAVSAPPSTTR